MKWLLLCGNQIVTTSFQNVFAYWIADRQFVGGWLTSKCMYLVDFSSLASQCLTFGMSIYFTHIFLTKVFKCIGYSRNTIWTWVLTPLSLLPFKLDKQMEKRQAILHILVYSGITVTGNLDTKGIASSAGHMRNNSLSCQCDTIWSLGMEFWLKGQNILPQMCESQNTEQS